jgi:predicted glutamine amidotransferase
MCGICGFIGHSKEHSIRFQLITALFEKTENRGEDASGFWGVDKDSKILYHKEPTKSSIFVQRAPWLALQKANPSVLLVHARAASMGSGLPSINKNNHPFTSLDKTVALIHNGRIPESDYNAFKKKYELLTDCDSEMYLRIFESNENRLTALRTLWSQLGRSQMAVAIGELGETEKQLWLFRNRYRPIWLADLRDSLGQVFFFSAPDIWEDAIWENNEIRYFLGRVKRVELSTEDIWNFTLSKNIKISRYEVKQSGNFKPWTFDGNVSKIKAGTRVVPVETSLNEYDELEKVTMALPPVDKSPMYDAFPNETPHDYFKRKENENKGIHNSKSDDDFELDNWSRSNLFPDMTDARKSAAAVTELINEIRSKLTDIETGAENLLMEDSMSADDYQELLTSLESASMDLEGTCKILDNLH